MEVIERRVFKFAEMLRLFFEVLLMLLLVLLLVLVFLLLVVIVMMYDVGYDSFDEEYGYED